MPIDPPEQRGDLNSTLDDILGYLNFSSGAPDVRFQQNLNRAFEHLESGPAETASESVVTLESEDATPRLRMLLEERLQEVAGTRAAFEQIDQAQAVLRLALKELPAAYRAHHRDLLFHQSDAALLRPFFLARGIEAILQQGPPWTESTRIVLGALAALNDFLGYRPVAVLETERKIEPYAHERVRPVPLYIRGAGVAAGRYHTLISRALALLQETEADILTEACFDLERLDELAFDPRAYDFDHPVNKRPNYHFGQWDPHLIDRSGYYRRFVITQVTLDALLDRVESTAAGEHPASELLDEAAAVLAGVMLMASAVSGSGPGAYDSSVSLSRIVPRIARFRDRFYQRLMARLPEPHAGRMKEEAVTLFQPFAAARQHLNQTLARLRAKQLQHVHLAYLYAHLGYQDASLAQTRIVPAVAARIQCEIKCQISIGYQAVDDGHLPGALDAARTAEDLLERAVECGAVMDPWNLLGFGGNFSLFPSLENTVRDHRADHLIEVVEEIFTFEARLLSEAAAMGDESLVKEMETRLQQLANWWDQFASLDVGDVDSFSGRELWESAVHVAEALRAWHAGGTASGDIAFWREHVEKFDSPKAYALVVQSLLSKRDYVASLALLTHWAGQADEFPLEEATHSFHDLAVRWLDEVLFLDKNPPESLADPLDRFRLAKRFLELLEANSEEYWQVPQFEYGLEMVLADELEDLLEEEGDEEEEDEDNSLFEAAYEGVTYRDSTGDGYEGELLEGGDSFETDEELDYEAARLRDRLGFLTTVTLLWQRTAAAYAKLQRSEQTTDPAALSNLGESLALWYQQARTHERHLAELLQAVHRHPIEPTLATRDAMLEFDRRRAVKTMILERIIAASVETADAARLLAAARHVAAEGADAATEEKPRKGGPRLTTAIISAMLYGDRRQTEQLFPRLLAWLKKQPLLYVPIARGGEPRRVVAAQHVLRLLHLMLDNLPRLGLLQQTCDLLTLIGNMERRYSVGPGAVTEYDRLFATGYRALVEATLAAAAGDETHEPTPDTELVDVLQALTQMLLERWLEHSRTLRLSVMERAADPERWDSLVSFIERYGSDLFVQHLFNVGHLRTILHQGVDQWLQALEREAADQPEVNFRLLEDLDKVIPRAAAIEHLELIFEAVIENYAEYRDYNTTTTQSDRGDLLYMLLDFLRLKTSYNRIAWNLRPVVIAHELLVRSGRDEAAALWRQAVAERTTDVANGFNTRLDELAKRYGIRLATVADRIHERFVRPLHVDRIRALIRPAALAPNSPASQRAFEILSQEITAFAEQPSGSGLDVPDWLVALEDEADRAQATGDLADDEQDFSPIPVVPLTFDEVVQQLRTWQTPE